MNLIVTVIQMALAIEGTNMSFVAADGRNMMIVSDPRCAGFYEVNPVARMRRLVSPTAMQAAFDSATELTVFPIGRTVADGDVIDRATFVAGMMEIANS